MNLTISFHIKISFILRNCIVSLFMFYGLTTIHKFENGTAGNISLSTFIVLLKVVGQINTIDNLLPELPESPYLMRRDDKKYSVSEILNRINYGTVVKSNPLG